MSIQYRTFLGKKVFSENEIEKLIFEAEKLGIIEITVDMVKRDKFVFTICRLDHDEVKITEEDILKEFKNECQKKE